MKILQIENLIRNYVLNDNEDNRVVEVLKDISFTVEKSEYIAIMGRSGCGKTTLLKVLGLIDKPTKGTVIYKEQAVEKLWGDELAEIRRNEQGFVFQDFYLLDSLSVQENIMLPMIMNQEDAEKMKQESMKWAEQMEIAHLLQKSPNELSGGEKQRVAICRALINDPDLILADEPTGNLDSKSSKVVIDSLSAINETYGKTIVMVTHDPIVASHCKKVILLKDGMILDMIERKGTREGFYKEILYKMEITL